MKTFVLVSATIELLFGSLFFLAPQLIPDLSDASTAVLALARAYGAGAIALGIFATQVWRNMENPAMSNAFLSTYLFFNIGAAAAFYNCYATGVMDNLAGTGLHTLLAIITAYFYMNKRK